MNDAYIWPRQEIPNETRIDVYANMKKIDSSHFIAVSNGIVAYDTKANKWSVHHQQILNDIKASSAYNPASKQLFIPQNKKILIFNVKTKQLQQFENPTLECMKFSKAIWMDNMCHIIGGPQGNTSHLIWNHETKQLRHIHTFGDYSGMLALYGLVHLRRNGNLLLFGGAYASSSYQPLDAIHKYTSSTGNWVKLDVKLPNKMLCFGCVITKCQKYIIIMGGSEVKQDFGNIFVLELKTMKFSESVIKLPFENICKAIIMENKEENDLLVHGWIKREVNLLVVNIPYALISLCCIWHSIEYVHVIDIHPNHWRINVDKILKGLVD